MNAYCRLVSLSVAIAAAAALSATPEPKRRKAGEKPPIPISFRAAPIHFPVDGQEHHPILTVRPAEATYVVEGTYSDKKTGTYSFTAKGTGEYPGSMTCRWTIEAPYHSPKKPAHPALETVRNLAQ